MNEQVLRKQLEESQAVIEHLHERCTRLQIVASNSASKVIELEMALASTQARINQLLEENRDLREPRLVEVN